MPVKGMDTVSGAVEEGTKHTPPTLGIPLR